MNVLFLSHRLPYAPNRGDRIRAFHLLREISKWASIDLVSLVHDDEEASHAGDLRSIVRSVAIAPVPKLRNLVTTLASVPTAVPATHTMLSSPDAMRAIDALLGRVKPDLVFSYCTGVAPLALSPPLARTPLVLDMVDVDSEKWASLSARTAWPKSWMYRREARLLRAFEAIVATQAKATLVVNAKEHTTLAAIAPAARVFTIENGIDTESFRPAGPPSPEPVVVFCGVMNYPPNIHGAAWLSREVWPIVRRARPDARLTIVGSSPTPAVTALGNEDQGITVTGAVPDVRPYLWKAAVGTAPLHTARGVQNKVLEAVAAGLPTVVTSAVHQGLPEQAHAACRVADTAEGFAAAIVTWLAESPQKRRELAESADFAAVGWERRFRDLREILSGAAGL